MKKIAQVSTSSLNPEQLKVSALITANPVVKKFFSNFEAALENTFQLIEKLMIEQINDVESAKISDAILKTLLIENSVPGN